MTNEVEPKPTGYKVRMISNKWYLRLFADAVHIGDMGPYTFAEANEEAKGLELPDLERSVAGDRP